MIISDALDYLECPDCQGKLIAKGNLYMCKSCKKNIFVKGNFIDLLPSNPSKLKNVYSKKAYIYYKKQFKIAPDTKFKDVNIWGEYEKGTLGYKVFLRNEEKLMRKFHPRQKIAFCDLSAASGFYTFKYAKKYKFVFHCDINLEYLRFAMKKAQELKVRNIIFVRSDYFKLPFQNGKMDFAICTDSLEYYGRGYDLEIIKSVKQKLGKNGVFIFDLHNKKFYAPYKRIFEYTKTDLLYLQRYFPNLVFYGVGRVPTVFVKSDRLFQVLSKLTFLPAIRHIGVLNNEI